MNYKWGILIGLSIIGTMGLLSYFLDWFSPNDITLLPHSIYDFKMKGIDGKEIDFSKYKGHALLIVNTASKCGKTPQYAGLEKLHEQYGEKVTILGFPANNFLWQEPGSNEEIVNFCKQNYGVKFQMFEKTSVRGSDTNPLYRWLKAKTGHRPDWNFAKYWVSADGGKVIFFNSSVQPDHPQIISQILN